MLRVLVQRHRHLLCSSYFSGLCRNSSGSFATLPQSAAHRLLKRDPTHAKKAVPLYTEMTRPQTFISSGRLSLGIVAAVRGGSYSARVVGAVRRRVHIHASLVCCCQTPGCCCSS
jgi:hypothetical protein